MKIVLINGWATNNGIWKNVAGRLRDPEFLCWNSFLQGDFTLPDKCVLAGWSMGGQLAMDISERPEVKGMVLVSSMTSLALEGNRPGIEPERCSMISRMLSRSRRGYLTSFFRECGASDSAVNELLDMADSFSMDELTAGLAIMFNHIARPAPWVPTVIIHGTDDRIVPFEVAEYIANSVLKKAELITVRGGSHLLPLTEADLVVKAVNDLAGSNDS